MRDGFGGFASDLVKKKVRCFIGGGSGVAQGWLRRGSGVVQGRLRVASYTQV